MATKDWLASLIPIAAVAAEYTASNINACKKLAMKFDSLVVVGVDNDLFVDRNRFERNMYLEFAEAEEAKPIARLKLSRGGKKASQLQAKLRSLELAKLRTISTIKAHRESELKSESAHERKQISNMSKMHEASLAKIVDDIKFNQGLLSGIVAKYGSAPIGKSSNPVNKKSPGK